MRVLLLEAGGDDTNFHYQVPCFHGECSEDEAIRWDFYVRHYGSLERSRLDPKFSSKEDGVLYPRAGTLGGCTAHNAMITIAGSDSHWEEIARTTGDDSWEPERMRRYFERIERCRYKWWRPLARRRKGRLVALARRLPVLEHVFGNLGRHGFDGWLSTQMASLKLGLGDRRLRKLIIAAAESALADSLGRALDPLRFETLKSRFDPNDWRARSHGLQGIWLTPIATSRGCRNGTREHVLATAKELPENLVVRTHALATRVLFDGGTTAVGVEYVDAPHAYRADPRADASAPLPTPRRVLVRREVILCAGAFNTPQLLKLSGVGPRAELQRHGIPVHVDLPGVGENLQDRYEVGVVSEVEGDFSALGGCSFEPPAEGAKPDKCFSSWQRGRGVYTTNGVVLAIVKKSRKERPEPDLFVFGLPAAFKGYYRGYSKDLERHKNSFTWAILKAHTRNTAGSVTLRSSDPRDVPEINFRYFDEGNDASGEDLDSVVAGVKFVRELMRRVDLTHEELVPGPAVASDEEIRRFVQDNAWGHHASCTCKLGPADDAMAVVDHRFRVHGTRNLRVVDASVFPRIPGFFIVTPTYMISEKASDVVLEDAADAGEPADAVRVAA